MYIDHFCNASAKITGLFPGVISQKQVDALPRLAQLHTRPGLRVWPSSLCCLSVLQNTPSCSCSVSILRRNRTKLSDVPSTRPPSCLCRRRHDPWKACGISLAGTTPMSSAYPGLYLLPDESLPSPVVTHETQRHSTLRRPWQSGLSKPSLKCSGYFQTQRPSAC